MTTIYLVHRDSLSCEAIVRQMANGELLMVAQCKGMTEPSPENRVFYWHSRDNGKTWGDPVLLWPEDGRAVYQTEVSVIGGEVTVYLTLHDGNFLDWECVTMKSHDNGYHWENAGKPPCFSRFTFFRGMIETRDHGRVMAYQRYPVSEELNAKLKQECSRHNKKIFHVTEKIPYNENGIIRSDDNGLTWECHPAIFLHQGEKLWHWGEPTVCELSDGRLVMLVRVNKDGYLWRSNSEDGGRTWCEPYRTDIPNPNNKVKLISMPDGRIALIHTPVIRDMKLTDRYPLEIWISDDNMETWSYKKTLMDLPGAISYPDGFCTEDSSHICLAVEFNRHDIYYIDHEVEGRIGMQKRLEKPEGPVDVVLDTDAYNEIDDQYALAYLLRSDDKLNTKAIYAAPFFNGKVSSIKEGMEKSYEEILHVLSIMGENGKTTVYHGADQYLPDESTPVSSPASLDLVERSKEYDKERPLYVIAIGAITNVASAILLDPTIVNRIVVVWLGGNAYHWQHNQEFNLRQDIAGARILFGCGVPVVQLPCMGVVSAFTVSGPELDRYFAGKNEICDYLVEITKREAKACYGWETWSRPIWDVAAIAWLLDGDFMLDRMETSPIPEYNGSYALSKGGQRLRYVYHIKRDRLLEDLYIKLTR